VPCRGGAQWGKKKGFEPTSLRSSQGGRNGAKRKRMREETNNTICPKMKKGRENTLNSW